jgi:hypothetical protein
MVTAGELDRAVAAGKVQLTRANARPVKCGHCRALCPRGQAVRLWIDGHKRGFLCLAKCAKGVGK